MELARESGRRRAAPEPIRAAVAMTLVRLGMQRFSLSAAAEQAAVSRSTLYNWFGDKQTAIEAAFDYLAEQFISLFAVAVQTEDTLAGQVGQAAAAVSEHRSWADPLALHTTDLLDMILDERGDDLMHRAIEFWRPLIEDAQRRKEVRETLDIDETAEWIIRALISIELLPPMRVDLKNPDAVRNYFGTYIMGGIGNG
ncbi:TetR/AcrR family transcriptional regulator [Jongsikchunia kroppenstedtii]|uniref:TetR/AcrR family transcriptional regulator n=1 Tax=Jongsikchunia kroppenstedtii TaxID=1121721 RepID=UPI000477991A